MHFLRSLLLGTLAVSTASATNLFVGSNLFYAGGLSNDEQDTLFGAMQQVGMKVLRVWLDGEGSWAKGTSITSFPPLEPNQIGQYDDTVLNLYDSVMIKANSYGIKLIIDMHSWNALSSQDNPDVYAQVYGPQGFYESSTAASQFDARLEHILTHNHSTLGKQWKDLSEYIFAFEAENEAMIGIGQSYISSHQQWQCDRANTIKNIIGNSDILVITGGESWVSESMQPDFLTCPYLDVISLHGYGAGNFDTGMLQGYVQQAQQNNKMLLFEEWGSCYFQTDEGNCPSGDPMDPGQRGQNIRDWAGQIAASGIPWLYWQILPQEDPHGGVDFEIGVNGVNWDDFVAAVKNSTQQPSAFDYSRWLLP